METVYRQKAFRKLTPEQQKDKLKKDSEYEIAHLNLTADLKAGRITQTDFEALHTKQWNDYVEWTKANGSYEEVSPEQQLAEAESGLTMQVEHVNVMRAELKMPLLEVKEKAGEK